jgi:hypothetical protein
MRRSPLDFNSHFGDWMQRANARIVRTIKARPIDLLEHDRSRMLALPPVPVQLGWRQRVRLGRDYYVRLDVSDYSVDPTAVGRMVDIAADLDRVRARLDGRPRHMPRTGSTASAAGWTREPAAEGVRRGAIS